MSTPSMSGMQMKEGTNMVGPLAYVPLPLPGVYGARSAGGAASLASKFKPEDVETMEQGGKRESNVVTTASLLSAPSSSSYASSSSSWVPTSLSILSGAPPLSVIVLDSGALISSGSASLLGPSAGFELLTRLYRENDGKIRFVTIPSVIAELKDEKTRRMMESLPFEIEIVTIEPAAIKEVFRFATLTGDAKTLSVTDIQIIALTLQFEKLHNGPTFVKTEPRRSKAMDAVNAASNIAAIARSTPAAATASPVAAVSSSSSVAAVTPVDATTSELVTSSSSSVDASSSSSSSAPALDESDDAAHQEVGSDDEEDDIDAASTGEEKVDVDSIVQSVAAVSISDDVAVASTSADVATASTTDSTVDSTASTTVATASAAVVAAPAVVAADDDNEGTWITPSTYRRPAPAPAVAAPIQSNVAIITTDYAMQNVLLQMGLRLLNLRGRSIRSIRSWMKKCHGCAALSVDLSREFCEKCGNHTMIRVSVTVNRDGLIRYWHGTRHLNLRGTIYSIPHPKAGRHANNLKLSEDVIDERIRKGGGLYGRTGDGGKQRQKTPNQLFADSIEFGLGRSGPSNNDQEFGFGKRNINAVKGGKKKIGDGKRK